MLDAFNEDLIVRDIVSRIGKKRKRTESYIIAIDGRCGSGKTHLAEKLKIRLDGEIIRMDDFFLPVSMRRQLKSIAPGENFDKKRFEEEIIRPLRSDAPFTYGIYSCYLDSITPSRPVDPSGVIIIEGTYSMHPDFQDLYDLKLFGWIEPKEQKERLKRRSPSKFSDFENIWIPLEEEYFRAYKIPEHADYIF